MAVLVDITKCIGCESCSVACRLWNGLESKKSRNEAKGGEKDLDDNNWTVIKRRDITNSRGEKIVRFVKRQCMHCEHPACAEACFSKALQREESGAVVYYPDLCVGCRYCMVACPYNVPKYQWESALPLVTKCQLCSSRLANDEEPACVSVCPTGALKFGERDELVARAKNIIQRDSRYVNKIYGEKELGGSEWLYISDVPFEELGFDTSLSEKPVTDYTKSYLSKVPFFAVGWGLFLTAMAVYQNRREKREQERENKKG